MSRLGLFTRPGPSNFNPVSKAGSSSHATEDNEDWYIPYHGPQAPNPERRREELEAATRERESWGEMLHEWLSDDSHGPRDVYGEYNLKANASTPNLERTRSHSGSKTRSRKHSSATNPSGANHSQGFIDLGRAGGVGDCPLPVGRTLTHCSSASTSEESSPQQKSSNRASLASIFTFGKKSLRLSLSMENVITGDLSRKPSNRLRKNSGAGPAISPEPGNAASSSFSGIVRRRANTSARQLDLPVGELREEAEDEYYNSYYSTLIVTPAVEHASPPNSAGADTHSSSMRSHPYANHFTDTSMPLSAPASATPTRSNEDKPPMKTRLITLLDPRSSSRVPDYLKPSPRNSILKASHSTPNLRNAQVKIAKGRQRWLAAETWCDAIFLPRPRFAMRLVDGQNGEKNDVRGHVTNAQGSGRIVSPPGSVFPTPRGSPSPSRSKREASPVEPTSVKERAAQVKQELRVPKKSRSLGNLIGEATAKRKGKERETVVGGVQEERRDGGVVDESGAFGVGATEHGGGTRPKSWALDDLALPSPVPSLAKVLEEGRQLEMDRVTWKKTASKSFLDSAARSISRARSRSVSGGTASAATLAALRAKQKESRAEAFEELRQSKFEMLKGKTLGGALVGGQVRPPTIHVRGPSTAAARRRSRSRSRDGTGTQTLRESGTHTFKDTQTGTITRSASRSHAHSNSLGNSINVSDASHAHSLGHGYGHGRSHSLSKSAMKLVAGAAAFCGVGGQSPAEEKREGDAITGAINSPATGHGRFANQMAEDAARPGLGNVMIGRSSPAVPGPSGMHSESPAPSEGTGEIGLAISAPLGDSSRQQHAGREPIRIRHPYATGARYSDRDPMSGTTTGDMAQEETRNRQPVLVHPYASASSQTRTQNRPTLSRHPIPSHLQVPPPDVANSIFAELTPDHIREFDPQEIRYSPDIRTPTVVTPAPRPHGSPEREPGAVDTGTIYVRPPPSSPPSPLLNELTNAAAPEYVYDRALSRSGAAHPFGASSKRTSELMFGDALARTLSMGRGSLDSGLGTSEAGYGVVDDGAHSIQDRSTQQVQPSYYATDVTGNVEDSPDADAVDDIVRTHDMYDATLLGESNYFAGQRKGTGADTSPGMLSHDTHASSPLENVVPPVFRRTASGISGISSVSGVSLPLSLKERLAVNPNGHSSGSSPGMTSHESSPPLSPRPINTMEDWERFKDLFYRPPDRSNSTAESDSKPAGQSRAVSTAFRTSVGVRTSASGGPTGSGIPVDVSPPSTVGRTNLMGLARQLSEDLKELQEENTVPDSRTRDLTGPHANPDHPIMWGRRQGGLKGDRPEGIENPTQVLARLGSNPKMNSGSGFSLNLPMQEEPEPSTSIGGPESNVPEDVESEISSVYDLESNEDITEHFRFGAVEAMLTPPIMTAAKRFSTEPDVVGHNESHHSEAGPSTQVLQDPLPPGGIPLNLRTHDIVPPFASQSPRSSDLLSPASIYSPHSQNVRSSYMTSNTDMSRMSGLSDFPEPPTIISTISRVAQPTYPEPQPDLPNRAHLLLPPRLVRESSYGTFGPSHAELGGEYDPRLVFEEEEYESSVGHAL